MKTNNRVFSVYVSDFAVELRDDQGEYFGNGRFVCSQRSYDSLLKFAKKWALNRAIPLHDYTQAEAQYQY
ncbi:MAG TPA: hypothetical protein IGR64_14600 [Leptolyngbyaceae cyanobacterium M65_K2018_010]|nr:hypothetical protein [Leptolyngbyaceae cyanobacterium M65_K2018_010]